MRHPLAILVVLLVASAVHAQNFATLKGHSHTITCLAYAPDGKTLASGSKGETVILWVWDVNKVPQAPP